jgi:NIMA (never in mitosis gene a)-related kinase
MGRHPFEAQNEGALIRKILRGTFTPISGPYSPALVQLSGQMLAFDPVRRPAAAQILQMPSVVNQVSNYNVAPLLISSSLSCKLLSC